MLAPHLLRKRDGTRVPDPPKRRTRLVDPFVRDEKIDVDRGARRPSALEPPLLKRPLEQDRADSGLFERLRCIGRRAFDAQAFGNDTVVAAHPTSLLRRRQSFAITSLIAAVE